ncbi:MAG: hypothetical protein ABS75_21350 [Pelagibacterium sp. SCN 63-23]|nr:MAG: hypothetical protein ABS75_21350 [Pelagibacterium sp. SCN 63-23]
MTNIRLLPVVILAVAALLVLKTMGLVTNGGYVLTGVSVAQAAGGGGSGAAPGETLTLPAEPTIEDTSPTLADLTPTLGEVAAPAGENGAAVPEVPGIEGGEAMAEQATNLVAVDNACAPRPVAGGETPSGEGEVLVLPGDCPPPADAAPQLMTPQGGVPLNAGGATPTEQALLERLGDRRADLESYEQELAMRASLVEAAEKRIEERQVTLKSIEEQIAALVEQRKQMEEGQFAGIVAMYETMKPKDAAKIFNALDIEVLLRVAKMMSPRKMAPILAEMDTNRAQELTVRLASAGTDPLDQMTPEALAALPQIVGQ